LHSGEYAEHSASAPSSASSPASVSLYWYQNDPNGCPIRLLSSTGEVLWAASYTAWAEVDLLHAALIDNPIRLQGQYADPETGLSYNRHRYFCPHAGQFISQDPIQLQGGDHLYAFAPNAHAWHDPLGLAKCKTKKTAESLPNRFSGVREASKYLQDMGVPRARRVEILQSFEVDAMRVRTAGANEFGLRYFSNPNRAGGSYLFETFPASRSSLAIKPEWNSMSGFRQFQVRPGTTILEGPASAQGPYLPGGQTQKFVLDWKNDLFSP
jgi:RHS repeat-associated protein